METIEIWKPVAGYEGLYEVSNKGKVRSLDRIVNAPRNTQRLKKGKTLTENHIDKYGYPRAELSKQGKNKNTTIHRLMMESFIPNPLNLPCINHKDENKTNNFIFINPDGSVDLEKSNLEWCDNTYNANYGTRNKRVSKSKEKSVIQLTLESEFVKQWKSLSEIQAETGYSTSAISRVANGKEHRNTAYGFKWIYA